MCRHLAAENFHRCLLNTLEVLYNILESHFQMMQWHLGAQDPAKADGKTCEADRKVV